METKERGLRIPEGQTSIFVTSGWVDSRDYKIEVTESKCVDTSIEKPYYNTRDDSACLDIRRGLISMRYGRAAEALAYNRMVGYSHTAIPYARYNQGSHNSHCTTHKHAQIRSGMGNRIWVRCYC